MAEFDADFVPVHFKDDAGRKRTAFSAGDEVAFTHRGWQRVASRVSDPAPPAAKKTAASVKK